MDGAQGVVTDAACQVRHAAPSAPSAGPFPPVPASPTVMLPSACTPPHPSLQFTLLSVAATAQVCGDTGGATRLVLCENAARGCLGGIHLYCCIPLRAEPWADAWYCSECSQVLAEVATREKRQAAQRAAKRVAAAEVRRKERQDRKQRRQEEAEQRRRQQQNAQQQQRQQQPAAGGGRAAGYGPPLGRPATPVGTVVAAAAAGRPTAGSGRLVGAGGGAVVPARASLPARQQLVRQQRPPASVGGTPVARTDTLTMLFESLKGDEEAAKRRAQEMGRVVDGTSRRLSSIITESDEAIRLLHERHSLKCCTLAGLKGVFPLQLPLAHQVGCTQQHQAACLYLGRQPGRQPAASTLPTVGWLPCSSSLSWWQR